MSGLLPHLRALRKGVRHLQWAVWPQLCPGCQVACCATDALLLCPLCRASLERNDGPRCRACDGRLCATDPGEPAAPCRCLLQAQGPAGPVLRAVRVPYRYGGAMAQLLVAGKYQGARGVFVALGTLLAQDPQVRALARKADALVPVPLGPARLRQRGYNPCTLLAHALKQALGAGAPGVVSALVRTDALAPRSFDGRSTRLQSAPTFVACSAASVRPLLIDDVLTTGGTLQAAALALRCAEPQGRGQPRPAPPAALAVARRA